MGILFTKLKQNIENLNEKAKAAVIGCAAVTVTGIGFCEPVNVNNIANKVVEFIFGAIRLGGLVMIAMGVIQIVKAVSEGESAPPNAIPKALGFLIGGIVMAAIEWILNSMLKISTKDFFPNG